MARIEFYEGSNEKHIAVLNDTAVPREGELINIRKQTWLVKRVTWAVDHVDDWDVKLRANVELIKP